MRGVPRRRAVLDLRTQRFAGGSVLVGGEPFRLLRLSERGVTALAEGDAAIVDRLVDAGLAHPVPARRAPRPGEIVIVVPVLDDTAGLERLLASLGDVAAVVVDDGSRPTPAATIRHVTAHAGARLVRHDGSLGPAAARNAARGAVAGAELVGFLDADAVGAPGWLEPLLGHFEDARVGAVAPRVRPARGRAPSRLFAYEVVHSPLDLGDRPGIVGAHRRLSYVPTAALVCRRAALDEVGWFDASLRVGEDVDLVRRLEAAGWVTRYEPASVVEHDCRRSVGSFVAQRFAYGRSAALLDRRHPGTVAPLEASGWSTGAASALLAAAVAGVGAGGHPARRRVAAAAVAVALALVAGPSAVLEGRFAAAGLDRAEARRAAVTLVTRGAGWAGTGLLTAVRRVWWPPVVIAAAARRRWRRPALLLLALARLTAVTGRAPVTAEIGLGVADDAAYGAGVWAGCLAERSLGALAPRRAPKAVLGGGG